MCIAIMGVVASALAMSFFASTRSIDQSGLRLANTHDSQMAASLFFERHAERQLALDGQAGGAMVLPGFQTCGPEPRCDLRVARLRATAKNRPRLRPTG